MENFLLPGGFLILVLVTVVFANFALSATHFIGIRLVAVLITLCVVSLVLFKKTPLPLKGREPILIKKTWLKSSVALATTTGTNMLNRWVNLLILGFFVPSSEIAFFQIALYISTFAEFGLMALNPLISPYLAKYYTENEHNRLHKLMKLSAKISFGLNIVIVTGFLLFGNYLIKLFYGTEYLSTFPLVIILLIGQLANSFFGPVGNLLNMTGYEKFTSKVSVIISLVNIPLTILMTDFYGAIGTAVAASVSLILWNAALFLVVKRNFNFSTLAI